MGMNKGQHVKISKISTFLVKYVDFFSFYVIFVKKVRVR